MDDPYIDNATERSMDEQTRKALELARDALKEADAPKAWPFAVKQDRRVAIAAIDAALSAPAAPVAQPVSEPSDEELTQSMLKACPFYGPSPSRDAFIMGWERAVFALRSAPAAPVAQEVVKNLAGLPSFLAGWKLSPGCKNNGMEGQVEQWISGIQELFATPAATASQPVSEQAAPRAPLTDDQIFASIPSIVDAVEFRRDQYGLTCRQWSAILGMQESHYSEFIAGRRELPKRAMRAAYAFGVPADALFQCRPTLGASDIDRRLAELEKQRGKRGAA